MLPFPNTLIMRDGIVNYLIKCQKSKYLDKIDINSLNYIAGPYLIDNNHWLAFIVYMIRSRVILLDPYLNRHHLKTSL